MPEERAQRRLAAILAADVVGYSRLMEQDEASTLAALRELRRNVLNPLVADHQGRIVKTMGDGVLVEFGSAVNAVSCAVELQRKMAAANDSVADNRRIVLRIGIALGDVVVEDGDLYGDGVNVAARLQQMAEPGDVWIAAAVHDQVGRKLALAYDDLGAREVKNMERPLHVFRIAAGTSPEAPTGAGLRAKASIAVLPFTSMGDDAGQQYLGDGITEDIITELSRYRSLRVIARNSSFQFRGPSVDLAAVRRRLGVQFVVEGSIRKIGSRLRLAVQLVDAATESHVWAEHYDREVEDIFAVQDHMTRAIAATLEGRVAASGAERAKRRPTKDWAAYDYFLQGRERHHRYNFIEAEPLFARAVELDPDYAQAYAFRAQALLGKYWNDLKAETKQEALDCATKALSLDDADPWCQMTMGLVLTHRGQRDLAGPYFDRAIALNPSDVQIAYMRAWWLARVGRANEALESLALAMQHDPFPPNWSWEARAIALLVARRYEDVIQTLARMSHHHAWDHAYVAACHAYLKRPEEARAAASEVLRLDPHFTVSRYARTEAYTLPAELKHLLDGMRKAGLPE